MSDPTASPALNAFLRGIEPRASVLVRAHAGPRLDAERLLIDVRRVFADRAARLPLAEWPLRYWGLLLARDELTATASDLPRHPLYALSHTRRLALLLRLVVGLEPTGGGRVLGVSETAFRALCSDAEEKLADLGVGAEALMRWHDEFQQQVRPAGAATAGQAVDPAKPAVPPPGAARDRPWRWPRRSGRFWMLVAMAILLMAAFVATFVWPPGTAEAPTGAAAVIGAGPAALGEPPTAPRRDLAAELRIDPDFALVAAIGAKPWDEGVGLLSWWSAEQGEPLPPAEMVAAPVVPDWTGLPVETRALLAPVEGAWPALEAPARLALLENIERWQALDPEQREALVETYRGWRALPALERSQRRARHQQWMALDAAERAALESVAARLAALSAADRQAVHAAFAALPTQRQRDWALGPRLGRQIPEIRPLLAFVPAADRAALIEALEALPDADRIALGQRIEAMGTAERAALRARVLAAAPAERGALLAAAAR